MSRPVLLTPEEKKLRDEAEKFARENKKRIAKALTDKSIFPRESDPVSVFMAGAPGAGKTESSILLLEEFGGGVIRIDPDELRGELPGYNGGNSWLFQFAVSILVDKAHDLALHQKQSFLLDGTLAKYDIAEKNVARSVRRGRPVQILYVYQEPHLAWSFVQAREKEEGRRIPLSGFIDQYFESRRVVNSIKDRFGGDVKVDLLVKNRDNSVRSYKANIDQIDSHLPERYDRESLFRDLNPER
ncbi:zeta toxin family protein [Halomonas cupida]|uniref:zeta toxin family protein n=1 Tax=Halomonas cupida TaxID=44933 RepID=UPI003EF33243